VRAAVSDALTARRPDTILAFQWHADTFTPPGDPILLASPDPYPDPAFRIGASGYPIQFHTESDVEAIRGIAEVDITAGQLEWALAPVVPRRSRRRPWCSWMRFAMSRGP
jgi:GMP synthase-like glutamine amidotransferase